MPQLAERDDFLRVGPAWAPALPTFACLATADFEAAGWADRARFAGAFVVGDVVGDVWLLAVFAGAFVVGDVGGDVWLLAVFAGAFVAVVVVLARALVAGRSPGDRTGAGVRLASPTVDNAGFVTVRSVRSATDRAAMPA
jgi:hypothetical protein